MIDVADPHIGVSLSPVDAHLANFEHGRDDDESVIDLMQKVSAVHKLGFRPEENGVFMSEGSTELPERGKAPFVTGYHGHGRALRPLENRLPHAVSQDVDDLAFGS